MGSEVRELAQHGDPVDIGKETPARGYSVESVVDSRRAWRKRDELGRKIERH